MSASRDPTPGIKGINTTEQVSMKGFDWIFRDYTRTISAETMSWNIWQVFI